MRDFIEIALGERGESDGHNVIGVGRNEGACLKTVISAKAAYVREPCLTPKRLMIENCGERQESEWFRKRREWSEIGIRGRRSTKHRVAIAGATWPPSLGASFQKPHASLPVAISRRPLFQLAVDLRQASRGLVPTWANCD